MEDEDYAAFCSIFRSLPPSSPPKEALRMDPNLSSQLDDGLKILARAAGVNRCGEWKEPRICFILGSKMEHNQTPGI